MINHDLLHRSLRLQVGTNPGWVFFDNLAQLESVPASDGASCLILRTSGRLVSAGSINGGGTILTQLWMVKKMGKKTEKKWKKNVDPNIHRMDFRLIGGSPILELSVPKIIRNGACPKAMMIGWLDGVRGLGWWHSQYDGKVVKFHGSKPLTRYYNGCNPMNFLLKKHKNILEWKLIYNIHISNIYIYPLVI